MDNLYKQFGRLPNKRVQKMKFLGLFAVVLAVGVGCQGDNSQTTEAADDYSARGPYPVGTMELVLEDDSRPLDITVWYPAQNPDGIPEEVTYYTTPPTGIEDELPIGGHALAEATPANDGPFPLIVYSHGNELYRHEAVYLMEQLASHGFVVFAADHFGDSLASLDGETLERIAEDTADYIVYRPWDITRLIDFAEGSIGDAGALSTIIDLEKVAVVGFSFGGWTALVSGGARLNYDEFDQLFCQNPEYIDDVDDACAEVLPQVDHIAQLAGLDAPPEGTWPSFGDPRIDAVVALSPGFTTQFGRTGLQSVTVPVLLMVGTEDIFLPLEFHTSWVFDNIASETKHHVIVEDASHWFYANSCDAAPWLPEFICDKGRWDDEGFDVVNHHVTAFLRAELLGDTDADTAVSITSRGVTVR